MVTVGRVVSVERSRLMHIFMVVLCFAMLVIQLCPPGLCQAQVIIRGGGKTYDGAGIPIRPYSTFPSLIRCRDGSVLCYDLRSSDGGLTWSAPEKLRATGCTPQPLLVSNGLLVASHGRPEYYLWVSPDGEGRTWTSRTLIGDGFGYTSIVEDRPGELVFVAHETASDGQSGLVAWRVAVERKE
jgi:hypothetical protein